MSQQDCKGREYEEQSMTRVRKNLLGQKFGLLTVKAYVKMLANNESRWLCECECGNLTCVDSENLRKGRTKSCGCNFGAASAAALRADISGQRFGRLVALEPIYDKKKHTTLWKCQCDCGNISYVKYGSLTSGSVKSCGCFFKDMLHSRAKDITGERYGALVALRPAGQTNHPTRPRTLWHCRCDCGNEIDVLLDSLTGGKAKSCGCQRSIGEYNIQKILQDNNIPFTAQQSFPDLMGVGDRPLRFDFAILDEQQNIIRLIEFDGPQHLREYAQFGDYEKIHEHDLRKNAYATAHNIPLIRIPYSQRDKLTLEMLLDDSFLYKEAK